MTSQSTGQQAYTFVLRGGGYKVFGATLFSVMLMCGVLGVVQGLARAVPGVVVLMGAVTIIFAVGLTRWIRARVVITPAVLILRTPFRTHRLGWAQVERADVVPTNANRVAAIVRVITTDGSSIKVDGVGTRWRRDGLERTSVGEAVRLINLYAAGPR